MGLHETETLGGGGGEGGGERERDFQTSTRAMRQVFGFWVLFWFDFGRDSGL